MDKKRKVKKVTKKEIKKTVAPIAKIKDNLSRNISLYYTTLLFVLFFSVFFLVVFLQKDEQVLETQNPPSKTYWLELHRKSNVEYLYHGVPGDKPLSRLVRSFKVKGGIPKEKPTPLPQLMGREYWVINKKFETAGNLETAPYFIELDVPWSSEEPYGPTPYDECNGQCNWELPGPFGLHGVAGDNQRLSTDNLGSSGCVRHTDEDITYLYSIINPNDNIRYYVKDL